MRAVILATVLAFVASVPSPVALALRRDVRDILVPVWDAVAIDGRPIVIPDDELARHDDRHPTMSFARHGNDTWATGRGACNGWGVVAEVGFDGSFSIDDGPVSTLIGCGQPRETIDAAFADALGRAAHWDIAADGSLALLDADMGPVLAFIEAPTPTLPGAYYLMSVRDDEDAEIDLGAADMPIRVTITDDAIATSVGCDTIGAAYRQDRHHLDVVPTDSIVTWCDGLMDLQTDLRSALLSTTSVHAGEHGGLVLFDTYGFVRVRLSRVDDPEIFGYPEQGERALHGTSWNVRALRDPAVLDEEQRPVRRDVGGDGLTLSFGDDGRISGSTGCGELSGDFTTERSWIAIAAHPRQPCEEAAGSWTEAVLLDALSRAGSFGLDESLVLRDRPGRTILLTAMPRV
ncbi:MAG: META domain-containing protein [Chloroflexi bacterium]|nr:META domain-containing protein [Chloroflexota bacterium]